MNIVQCTFCRKPFAGLGGKICPECLEQIDRDFITVRDYIDEHKHSNIPRIAEETEVPEKHIIFLIKEGRLILDNPSGDGGGIIFCEVCKKSIPTGRVCDACAKKLSNSIDSKGGQKPAEQRAAPDANDLRKLGRIR